MSLDSAQLEAAIRANDATGVRELLRDATEAQRTACAKTLKELLKGPGWPQEQIFFVQPQQLMSLITSGELDRRSAEARAKSEPRKRYDEWRELARGLAFRVARFGLAGGVAAAAEAAREFVVDFHCTSSEIALAAAILDDRRPEWLARFVDRGLSVFGEWGGGIDAWPLARGLIRLGAIERPDVPEYTTLMPDGVRRPSSYEDMTPASVPTVADALLADPELLDDKVWRLFTVPDAGKVLADADHRQPWASDEWKAQQTWSQGLALLCEQGHLDRDRLIDACLDAFTRDFHPNRVTWYATMLDRLDPSTAEIAARASRYLGLLAATSKVGVVVGQGGLAACSTPGWPISASCSTPASQRCYSRRRALPWPSSS